MAGKAESITCLDILDIPFKLVLGDTVGLALKKVRNSTVWYEKIFQHLNNYYTTNMPDIHMFVIHGHEEIDMIFSHGMSFCVP